MVKNKMKKWKITNSSVKPITLHVSTKNIVYFDAGESIITSDEQTVKASKQFKQFDIEESI